MILRGGRFDTAARAISIEEMRHSLEGMAALHGSSWEHPELERHQWLQIAMGPDTWGDDYWTMMESYFARSEEHTSELQSLMRISYDVFCLKTKMTYCKTRASSLTDNDSTQK